MLLLCVFAGCAPCTRNTVSIRAHSTAPYARNQMHCRLLLGRAIVYIAAEEKRTAAAAAACKNNEAAENDGEEMGQ